MNYLIIAFCLLITTAAFADYRSAREAVEIQEKAQRDADFARLVPSLNQWIDSTLLKYSKKLGGVVGAISYRADSVGMYSTAEWKTNRGYECAMMVGIVLMSGRFNMIVQCASPAEGKKTGEVFRHGTGGW